MQYVENMMEQAVQSSNPRPKVLGIGGSPRKGGNSDVILQHVLKGVTDQSCAAEGIHLRDVHYQGCIGCERCRKDKICTGLKDGMSLIYPDVLQSKGLVLVSPTHHFNITAWMKAFIDRLYCFYHFEKPRPGSWSSRLAGQQRKAIVVGICEQENETDMGFTLDAMRLPLEALGYEVITAWPVFRLFDRAKIKENQELLDYAEKLGADLAQSL